MNGRQIEGNDTMGSLIERANETAAINIFVATSKNPASAFQNPPIRKNNTTLNDSFAHLDSQGIKSGARDLNKLESVDRLLQNVSSQANNTTAVSAAATGYHTTKTQRCNTAAGLGGANPRSNGRALHGSKQVINHIQTIIRNTNATKTSNIDNNESFEEFNGSTGGLKNLKQTNNFFTTDIKDSRALGGGAVTSFGV